MQASEQLNVQILQTVARAIRRDAKKHNKSLQGVINQILKNFADLPEGSRARALEKAQCKRMGRKVAA